MRIQNNPRQVIITQKFRNMQPNFIFLDASNSVKSNHDEVIDVENEDKTSKDQTKSEPQVSFIQSYQIVLSKSIQKFL